MITLPYNINSHVLVKLTPFGKAECEKLGCSIIDAGDGWSKWQMWNLMATFGKHLSLGAPFGTLPFETNIRIMHEIP